ncbi:hypothetical protein B0I72DRAFT_138353 [Yarrowia lipolytica]|uniref:Uncharacterized protein n=1 Tax=Yarrowia lipolytica TaxID=4952 RepID=A0A371C3A3_YARLL|nr:hypothetical protein BKA91DRAFT_140587 [Yarrowia lipolytica]KAE8170359.1 hypothetical protein BKA90DRAFT_140927 [Yarrowia lipolytica]RDW24602.1 hypothetical protein B0I71DRAFT_134016 [Yarrowia lipolytica]RDW32294.1 hypothetical protein B0I72DRAFT_138353 [Yarrowia lipolytica]RDW39058.1 hypothetical protein B0I73DRAFT_132671 [Yarrowia lipolytica]
MPISSFYWCIRWLFDHLFVVVYIVHPRSLSSQRCPQNTSESATIRSLPGVPQHSMLYHSTPLDELIPVIHLSFLCHLFPSSNALPHTSVESSEQRSTSVTLQYQLCVVGG